MSEIMELALEILNGGGFIAIALDDDTVEVIVNDKVCKVNIYDFFDLVKGIIDRNEPLSDFRIGALIYIMSGLEEEFGKPRVC